MPPSVSCSCAQVPKPPKLPPNGRIAAIESKRPVRLRSAPADLLAAQLVRRSSHLDAVLTEQYLRREYLDKGRSSSALAGEVGCSHKTILRHLRLFGISSRGRGVRPAPYPELQSVRFLEVRLQAGRTASDIAAELGCSRSAAAAAVRAAGLARHERSAFARTLSREYLARAYTTERRSLAEIAEEVGCGPSTVARHLRRHRIATRPRGGRRSTHS